MTRTKKFCLHTAALYISLFISLPLAHCWNGPFSRSAPAAASQPTPKFAVVPSNHYREGQGQIRTLEGQAEGETFLDRMLGINCYSLAVAQIKHECKRLDQEQKSRLALRLANCQLATQGHDTHDCGDTEPLRRCVDRLPDREHQLYVEFLTHCDSMCLFIQNQEFEKYTENMLNRLSEGAGFAREQLTTVSKHTAAIAGDTTAIMAASQDAAARLKEYGELQKDTMMQLKEHRNEAAAALAELSVSQAAALRMAAEQVQKTQELGEAQGAVKARLESGHEQVEALFAAIGERAEAVARAQGTAAAAQQVLGEQLQALSDGSQGLRSAVDTLALYQQRSDAALIKLLGRSYTLDDAFFYGAGSLAAAAAGASRSTQRARLPIILLMVACLVAERLLLDHLHPWMDVDAGGDVLLAVPLPGWLPIGPGVLSMNFKWAVRRVCIGAGAALLAFAAIAYRDYERVNYSILLDIREEQRRQEETLRCQLHNQQKLAERMEALGALEGRVNGGKNPQSGTRRANTSRALIMREPVAEEVLYLSTPGAEQGQQHFGHAARAQNDPQISSGQVLLQPILEHDVLDEMIDPVVQAPLRKSRSQRRDAGSIDAESGGISGSGGGGARSSSRAASRRRAAADSTGEEVNEGRRGSARNKRGVSAVRDQEAGEPLAAEEAGGNTMPAKRRRR